MRCRARANGEVRDLNTAEVAALVPWLYEPIEDERAAPEPTRDSALLAPEAPLETVAHTAPKKRRRKR